MLTSLSSNAITAKAKAIYGKRLTSAEYHDLMRQRSVSDVAAYLKQNTSYSKYLSGISEMQIHRGQLENLLEQSRMEKFLSLLHYDFSKSRGFYHYAIMNVEVMVIQRAIMLLNLNKPQDIITAIPSFMQDYVCFDFLELSKIRSFDELLGVLSGTPYRNVLTRYSAENGRIDLTECEHALKVFYYESMFKLIDQNYKGKTRKELREIVSIEVEILNLSMIYRLKTYFHRPPEVIKRQILPFYYKLTKRSLNALLEPLPDEEFVRKMRMPAYNSKMADVEYNYIEDYTKRLEYIVARKLMRFSTSAPVAFYALMTLVQFEIENLVIIIEGIRYGDPVTEIEKLLIIA